MINFQATEGIHNCKVSWWLKQSPALHPILWMFKFNVHLILVPENTSIRGIQFSKSKNLLPLCNLLAQYRYSWHKKLLISVGWDSAFNYWPPLIEKHNKQTASREVAIWVWKTIWLDGIYWVFCHILGYNVGAVEWCVVIVQNPRAVLP